MKPTFDIETGLFRQGYRAIAGVDEAGRGPLAGPLAVGLVVFSGETILNPDKEIFACIDDSKRLSERQRNSAYERVKSLSVIAAVKLVSNRIIDRLNVNRATEYALAEMIASLDSKPDIIIMDGNFNFSVGIPFIPVKSGDRRSLSIASASIIAKVRRDRVMERFDEIYPGYNFIRNKGYGTAAHISAIRSRGRCPIHRKSYRLKSGEIIVK